MSSSLRPCCPDLSVFASLAISCSFPQSSVSRVNMCVCLFLSVLVLVQQQDSMEFSHLSAPHTCWKSQAYLWWLVGATTQEWLIRSLNDYSHSLWWLRFLLLRVMKLSCTEEIAGICGSEVNVLSNCKYQVSWSAAQHLEGELLAPGIRTHHYCGFTFLETVVITYQCKLNSLFWRSCAFESYFILQQTDTNNSV